MVYTYIDLLVSTPKLIVITFRYAFIIELFHLGVLQCIFSAVCAKVRNHRVKIYYSFSFFFQGVIGMKSERIQRQLLEMLELDSCEYVRIQVIRTLADLGLTNIKVMRALKSVERNEGALSRSVYNIILTLLSIQSVYNTLHVHIIYCTLDNYIVCI